jgi:hypothetical protein
VKKIFIIIIILLYIIAIPKGCTITHEGLSTIYTVNRFGTALIGIAIGVIGIWLIQSLQKLK